jgi:hypothetical protein
MSDIGARQQLSGTQPQPPDKVMEQSHGTKARNKGTEQRHGTKSWNKVMEQRHGTKARNKGMI